MQYAYVCQVSLRYLNPLQNYSYPKTYSFAVTEQSADAHDLIAKTLIWTTKCIFWATHFTIHFAHNRLKHMFVNQAWFLLSIGIKYLVDYPYTKTRRSWKYESLFQKSSFRLRYRRICKWRAQSSYVIQNQFLSILQAKCSFKKCSLKELGISLNILPACVQ